MLILRRGNGLWFPALLLFSLLLDAGSGRASPESLARTLESTPPIPGVSVSILFEPLDGSGPRVSYHDQTLMPPGSVMKIVTSAAALSRLGPEHRFETCLLTDGLLREGRLDGDLYLVGDGDPFLVTERLWLLAHELSVGGVQSMRGRLIVDAEPIAHFQAIRDADGSESSYAAPVSRLAVNFNSLSILIRPSAGVNHPAAVRLDPFPVPGLSLQGEVVTTARMRRAEISVDRIDEEPIEEWRVTGSIPVGSEPMRIRRAATDPARLAGGTLAGLLEREGIVPKAILFGKAPESARRLVSLESLPLGVLIRSMNVWSNNFMADLLLADLCDPGEEESVGAKVAAWLQEVTGTSESAVVIDGSGLSPGNRLSAEQIVRLLVWASKQEAVFPDLYASFARPGGEGTLKRRFAEGNPPTMRAKTGTLGDEGVSAIAGYIDHPDAGRYAFCILMHQSPRSGMSVGRLRLREEAWLKEFARP